MLGFLYGQTEYELESSVLHIKDYISWAKDNNLSFLTITDSNMYGHYKFYKECINNNIKPIMGLEVKIEKDTIICYALNNDGYSNLKKISYFVSSDKKLDLEILKKYSSNIFFITLEDYSLEKYNSYKPLLKNVGVGIENNEAYLGLYNLCKDNNIRVFPIKKSLYLKNDYDVYEALSRINGNEARDIYQAPDLNELELFNKNYGLAFSYLEKMVEYINYNLYNINPNLPYYKNDKNKSSKDYLFDLCTKGLKKRLEGSNANPNVYYERLKYELDIIDKMGYNDYFLIVWDFIKYAKMSKILVGPGRGSAGGSLVSWSIGISSVDPIAYDLLFERFLNPERITMPDIDTDFPDDKRDEVIGYVRDKYGKNHLMYIRTFDTYQIKSAARALCKLNRISDDRTTEIVRVAAEAYEDKKYNELMLQYQNDNEMYKLLKIANKLVDLPKSKSIHPSGIILSNEDVFELVPICEGPNGCLMAELEASDLESMGLLKIDFLSLSTLRTINSMLKPIKEDNISIYNIKLDDSKTYELLRQGDTLGIFQLDNRGITNALKKIQPSSFSDLVALLALYRPGPMENIDEYVARKEGKRIEYIHPDLEPILKETYGIIVYQEQIMKIAMRFAGYTLGGADVLRRAVSKKKEDVLIKERQRFVECSTNKGYSLQTAHKIYDEIVKFADYGFNKSHSVVYAKISYIMAYIKANYPEVFLAKSLTSCIGAKDDTINLIKYANSRKIRVYPPSINGSTNEYLYTKANYLRMPLNSIKGVTKNHADIIIEARRDSLFDSFEDFKKRVKLPDSVIKALIEAGTFDVFKKSKKYMINNLNSENDVISSFLVGKIEDNSEYSFDELKAMELNALGINLEYNIYRDIDRLVKNGKSKKLANLIIDVKSYTYGSFIGLKELSTKNDEIMCVGQITDGMTILDMVIFPKPYLDIKQMIVQNKLFRVHGTTRLNEKKSREEMVIDKIEEIKKDSE